MSQQFHGLDEAMSNMQASGCYFLTSYLNYSLAQVGDVENGERSESGHTKPESSWIYGYCVSFNWLCEMAAAFLTEIQHDIPAQETIVNADIDPIYSFRAHFEICSIGMGSAIPLHVPADCNSEGFVDVLYIFSDLPDYRQRPTQKQVDALTEFKGREPQWWVVFARKPFRLTSD
ncbi:hypothetical protein BDR07DRAFT_1491521 [Suillus spraguei]|nr:hypothetical protein BDR07DRAFT_1491521 [Suillus spraguei]